jgi:DNA-binding XRE family transcriptional regulator
LRSMRNIRKQMGHRIRQIRLDRGDTQAGFGLRINCSPQSVSGYEQGDVWAPWETAIAIAKLGNMSLDTLVLGANDIECPGLTREEAELIKNFREANRSDQLSLIKFAKSLSRI